MIGWSCKRNMFRTSPAVSKIFKLFRIEFMRMGCPCDAKRASLLARISPTNLYSYFYFHSCRNPSSFNKIQHMHARELYINTVTQIVGPVPYWCTSSKAAYEKLIWSYTKNWSNIYHNSCELSALMNKYSRWWLIIKLLSNVTCKLGMSQKATVQGKRHFHRIQV